MKAPIELARRRDPDEDETERIRDRLRMDPEALEALRRMCVSPGRNAMAQIAAIRLRMEYTVPRPAQEARVTLDATGPLTVRFDLSGVDAKGLAAASEEVDVTPKRTPPGGRSGGGRAAAATSPSTEKLPFPDVSPTSPYTE